MVKKNRESVSVLSKLSVRKKIDEENISYFMAITGVVILVAWEGYMLLSIFSGFSFGAITPEVLTIIRHIAIVLVGFILAFKGTSRLYSRRI